MTDKEMPGHAAAQDNAEEPRSLSLMGGIVGNGEMSEADLLNIDGGSGHGKIAQGTLLLFIVAVIGAGSLYAMRVTQSDLGSAAVSEDVEARIAQVLARMASPNKADQPIAAQQESLQALFRDTSTIVAMFADDPTQQQIPIEYVQKNPFAIALPGSGKDGKGEVAVVPVRDRSEELRRRALETELSRLELQTVMQSRNPVAVINGQLVQMGQSIGSFTVTRIEGLWVELSSGNHVFRLEMKKAGEDSRVRNRR